MTRILAVGAGSMGRRRLRDLIALNAGEVILYEPATERCREVAARYGIRGFTDLETAFKENPDVVTVSVPPALHDNYVARAMAESKHVMAEVPFAFGLEAMERVGAASRQYPKILGISHTIRYYPPFRLIRDLIHSERIGRPYYLEFSLGNYLPDWHPYEDYRKFYVSDVGLGGAGMDMLLHELAAIQWWLGPVRSVYAQFTKLSDLEIQGPDNHDIMLEFERGTRGLFHHDIIERGTPGRHVRIVGSSGSVEWHQWMPVVRVVEGRESQMREVPFSEAADWSEAIAASRESAAIVAGSPLPSGRLPEEGDAEFRYESCYLRELRHFLDAVRGERTFSMANVDEELHNVRVFHAIRRSAAEGRPVAVAELSGLRATL